MIDHEHVTEDLSLAAAIQVQLNCLASTTNPNGNVSSMYHPICIISVAYIHSINQLIALNKIYFNFNDFVQHTMKLPC